MKEILQAVVIFLLAIPFIYMMFDVGREVMVKFYRFISREAKPVISGIINFLFE